MEFVFVDTTGEGIPYARNENPRFIHLATDAADATANGQINWLCIRKANPVVTDFKDVIGGVEDTVDVFGAIHENTVSIVEGVRISVRLQRLDGDNEQFVLYVM